MNFNRQIFFVKFGSFDTHGNQAEEHPILLRELSVALWKFQKALEDMGVHKKVVTFTTSDFGRTIGNNGDGTDLCPVRGIGAVGGRRAANYGYVGGIECEEVEVAGAIDFDVYGGAGFHRREVRGV